MVLRFPEFMIGFLPKIFEEHERRLFLGKFETREAVEKLRRAEAELQDKKEEIDSLRKTVNQAKHCGRCGKLNHVGNNPGARLLYCQCKMKS